MKISNYSIRTTMGLIVTAVLILNLGQGITKGIQIVEKNERDLSLSSLIQHDPIDIRSDSGLEVFPGSGTAEDPYIIEDYNITTTDDYGIFIYNTTKYFIIRNCYVDAGRNGIDIYEVAYGTVTIIYNTCNYNSYCGIWLRYSGSSTIANNTCNYNDYHGIWLEDSDSSTIANNTCNNNDWYGIHLEDSDSSTVANNSCNNKLYGINLHISDFCNITYNLLLENEDYGVYLTLHSDNNIIHHNTFVDNNLGGSSQARDEGSNNFWYDTETLEGNYWSDWSGTGSYSILGSTKSVDLYPLDEPSVESTTTESTTTESTTTEHTSVESTTDENPLNFTFTLIMVVVTLMLIRIISKKKINRTMVRNSIET